MTTGIYIRGKPIEELNREELIEAIADLEKVYQDLCKNYEDIIKILEGK